MINITLPDGNIKRFDNPPTGLDVAGSISEGLARNSVAMELDSSLVDLSTTITGDVRLRLHPHDFETLGPHVQRLTRVLSRLGKVDVAADPTIAKGGCIVDTHFGTIDQQVESQLRRIEQELG